VRLNLLFGFRTDHTRRTPASPALEEYKFIYSNERKKMQEREKRCKKEIKIQEKKEARERKSRGIEGRKRIPQNNSLFSIKSFK
jgi:uncharacterized protein YdaU (DUF1376 family)